MGTYLLKKYERQFYCSRPNPYSGKAVNAAHKLPQFRKRVQASKKSRGDSTNTFCQIITEDMATWAYDNRGNIDIGIFLEKKTIDSIISLHFNPGGCVAQYRTAEQGISILAF
jgi:hypothetical protein